MTPEQARTLAEDMERRVKDGGDPLEDKRKARDALTVSDLLDRYLASAHYATKADKVQRTGRGEIERHLKPLLGRKVLASVEADDIRRAFADIASGKTAKTIKTGPRGLARVRGGQGVARHACRLLRAAFRWAAAERIIDRDPTSGVNFGTDGERELTLERTQYESLFKTLATMETERRLSAALADAIRVVALTGARRGEIFRLRWCDVDLRNSRIVLVKHKTAKASKKPRIIVLEAAALAIISKQPQGDRDDFVFRTEDGKPVALDTKKLRSIRQRAGLPESFGMHGLRHALASALALDGGQVAELMATLGHSQPTTVMRYVHFADRARARLAKRAARSVLAGMAAAENAPKADVVPLSKR